MIRLPGYGDHLAATVDPHIYDRRESVPPGFADVVAGFAAVDAHQAGWQVIFTVADRDESVALAQRLGATVLSSVDTEWTRTAVIRDPQGATLTVTNSPRRTGEPVTTRLGAYPPSARRASDQALSLRC